MAEKSSPQESGKEPSGSHETLATHDLREEMDAALRRYRQGKEQAAGASADEGPLPEGVAALRIEIENAETPLLMPLKEGDLVIGRRDPMKNVTPALDLSPYKGYQMGVSRRHALIRFEKQRLYLIDAGSRNGTYLNGHRLKADTPVSLRDGDQMAIGKVVMRVYLQGV